MHFIPNIFVFITVFAKFSSSDDPALENYGYDNGKVNGPKYWPGACQSGLRQSPVDISPSDIDVEPLPRMHFANYAQSGPITLMNNGKTVIATGFDRWGEKRPYIRGGGLIGNYYLVNYHFHWSQKNYTGSEHTLASLHYPAEMHFVHERKGALNDEKINDLAVVSVFLALGSDNKPFSSIEPHLKSLIFPNATAIIDGYGLAEFFPSGMGTFYRYEGSLTTPPCAESVIWTIIADPLIITSEQMDAIRKIQSHMKEPIENYRKVNSLNGRRIKLRVSSFSYFKSASIRTILNIFLFKLSLLFTLF